MDITLTPKEGEPLIQTLTVVLSPEDYKPEFEKTLKDYRKRIQLPGFRPGTVPPSLVRKRFGASILAEQVNKQVSEALTDYLKETPENFLGRPYLAETSFEELDVEADNPLSFTFEVGKYPVFELNIDNLPSLESFEVTVTDEDVMRQIARYRYQHSHGEQADHLELGQDYLVQGILSTAPRPKLAETPDAPEAVTYDYRRTFMAFTALLPGVKALVAGKPVGTVVELVPAQTFADDREGASELRISEEEYARLKNETFTYDIRSARTTPQHEINAEFFAHIFPENPPADEAEFNQRMKEKLEAEAQQLSEMYLNFNLKKVLLENHPFELPDRVLQSFFYEEIKEQQKDLNAQRFAQQYAQYREEMRLHLIRQKLAEKFPNVVLSDEDFKDTVRDRLKAMFPTTPPPAISEETANTDLEAAESTPEITPDAPEGVAYEEVAVSDNPSGELLPEENPMLDMLLSQVMSNPQFAEREFQNAQNARFYEILRTEVFPVKEKQATFADLEHLLATSGY